MRFKGDAVLHSVEEDGDFLKFNHVADVSPISDQVAEFRKNPDGNWTDSREQRLIGCIPPIVWERLRKERPEVVKDGKKLWKWLNSEEGELWRTVPNLNTGRSGKVVVK